MLAIPTAKVIASEASSIGKCQGKSIKSLCSRLPDLRLIHELSGPDTMMRTPGSGKDSRRI